MLLVKYYSAEVSDRFPACVLKVCRNQLAFHLANLSWNALGAAYIIEKFLSQSIVPVFEKGNEFPAVNCRPISLTSYIINVFENVMRSRITYFHENNKQLNPNQYGFCNGRNCITQFLRVLGAGSNTDAIYLDFSKAFIRMNHKIPLENKTTHHWCFWKVTLMHQVFPDK